MHKQTGKITDAFLGFEDHGILTAALTIDYGGSGQTIGNYNLSGDSGFGAAFIAHLLRAAGVQKWSELKGRVIVVLQHEAFGPAAGIENLPFEKGETFVFEELAKEYRDA